MQLHYDYAQGGIIRDAWHHCQRNAGCQGARRTKRESCVLSCFGNGTGSPSSIKIRLASTTSQAGDRNTASTIRNIHGVIGLTELSGRWLVFCLCDNRHKNPAVPLLGYTVVGSPEPKTHSKLPCRSMVRCPDPRALSLTPLRNGSPTSRTRGSQEPDQLAAAIASRLVSPQGSSPPSLVLSLPHTRLLSIRTRVFRLHDTTNHQPGTERKDIVVANDTRLVQTE